MSHLTDMPSQRAQWSSEPAFVFSMAAAAVGLGNLWRFPYMVGEYGGAAFILAYIAALAVLGLPIMIIEVGIGRLAQANTVATYRRVRKSIGTVFGWAVVLLTVIITSYYLVITGWTMGYAVQAFGWQVQTFDAFTSGYASLWYFVAVTGLAVLFLIKGVGAIERLSRYLMPVLFLIVIILVITRARAVSWPLRCCRGCSSPCAPAMCWRSCFSACSSRQPSARAWPA